MHWWKAKQMKQVWLCFHPLRVYYVCDPSVRNMTASDVYEAHLTMCAIWRQLPTISHFLPSYPSTSSFLLQKEVNCTVYTACQLHSTQLNMYTFHTNRECFTVFWSLLQCYWAVAVARKVIVSPECTALTFQLFIISKSNRRSKKNSWGKNFSALF